MSQLQNFISPNEIRAKIFGQHAQQPLIRQNAPTYNLTGGRRKVKAATRKPRAQKHLKGLGKRKRRTKTLRKKRVQKKKRQTKKKTKYTLF